jgi:hypothetical protein
MRYPQPVIGRGVNYVADTLDGFTDGTVVANIALEDHISGVYVGFRT